MIICLVITSKVSLAQPELGIAYGARVNSYEIRFGGNDESFTHSSLSPSQRLSFSYRFPRFALNVQHQASWTTFRLNTEHSTIRIGDPVKTKTNGFFIQELHFGPSFPVFEKGAHRIEVTGMAGVILPRTSNIKKIDRFERANAIFEPVPGSSNEIGYSYSTVYVRSYLNLSFSAGLEYQLKLSDKWSFQTYVRYNYSVDNLYNVHYNYWFTPEVLYSETAQISGRNHYTELGIGLRFATKSE